MSGILARIYGNYLMPSRIQLYAHLVRAAKESGLLQTSVRDFVRGKAGGMRALIHRHDVDTDIRTARKLFEIETALGAHSSFYFRKATLDFGFMREIEDYGSEASYHYEEIADFARRHRLTTPCQVRARLPEIRAEFCTNFFEIEQRLGSKLVTVASHGDFINRYLHMPNTEILEDRDLRRQCGIECESYDDVLIGKTDIYISDRAAPQYFHPLSPFDAVCKYNVIYLLTHPAHWETNWLENTKFNIGRCVAEWQWQWRAVRPGVRNNAT
jgi:hypothetical protein